MTTAYTSLLGLALPVTGELSGTWGDTVNNGITSLVDSAVAGTTNVSTDADVTLTTTTGAANTAREAILLFSGSRTALRTITAPAQSKIYTVINATTGGYSVKLVGAGPTTGVTIVAGESAVCAWNGSDFVKVSNAGGSSSFVDLTVSGNLTLSGGTANGVLYLNGSKVVTSGSALSFDGTNFGIGGTGQLRFATSGGSVGDNWIQTTSSYDLTLYCGRGSTTQYNLSLDYFKWAIAASEQMRLTSTGLGIGTSSPSAKLNVVGTGDMSGIFESTGTSNAASVIIRSGNGTTSGLYAYARFINNDTTGQDWRVGTYGGNNFVIRNQTASTFPVILDTSGNLGLGVTPSAWGSAFKAISVLNQASFCSDSGVTADLVLNGYQNGSAWIYRANGYATLLRQESGAYKFFNSASGTAGNAITFTQAMTLDSSGNLLVGTTSAGAGIGFSTRLAVDAGSGEGVIFKTSGGASSYVARIWNSATTGDNLFMHFATDSGNTRGSITYNRAGGLTAYNTSSDYRLKENIVDLPNALVTVAQLKPRQFDWKETGNTTTGFIAHELAEVCPHAVTGEKDAVDTEGNPQYQGIDVSFLVATLTAAIQEQQAIIESLKARLDAANL